MTRRGQDHHGGFAHPRADAAGDLERCLIVAPGSLVEQWQTELSEKFGLRFDLLTNALVESTATGNAFVEHPRLIARLDQLSRKTEWHDKLQAEAARWDLVIIDEAHKLAAHYFGSELKTTRRYDLGMLIGSAERTRNLLLMTATPHNGRRKTSRRGSGCSIKTASTARPATKSSPWTSPTSCGAW